MLTALQCTVFAVAVQAGGADLADSLPAVALIESSLGARTLGDDGRSYGVFQMTVDTAQEVLTDHPRMRHGRHTDAQVKAGLLTDIRWSANLAAVRLRDLRKAYGWEGAHIAYNAGVSGYMDGRARGRAAQVRAAIKEAKRLGRTCER